MTIMEQIYNGLTEQIDFYSWVKNDDGSLSDAQKEHLVSLRNSIQCFGERAEKWVELANSLLCN